MHTMVFIAESLPSSAQDTPCLTWSIHKDLPPDPSLSSDSGWANVPFLGSHTITARMRLRSDSVVGVVFPRTP